MEEFPRFPRLRELAPYTTPKERRQHLKETIIEYYSNGTMACANPFGQHKEDYKEIRALTIDHIDGKGHQHLQQIKTDFYIWLRKNHFPEGFQVLCMNCQMIKKFNRDEFSHQGRGRVQ